VSRPYSSPLNPELLEKVRDELLRQSAALSRTACVKTVLEKGVFLIEAANLEDAADLASQYAPEHLELMVAEPTQLAPRIKAAGAIFHGPWTPEPVGDFVAGPSHVLPTGGAAKFFSGLGIEHFFRRMSLVSYERDALAPRTADDYLLRQKRRTRRPRQCRRYPL
jgi:histidinol dehydrogenase